MPEKEVWRQITGFDGRYEVSSFGSVRNCRTQRRLSTKPNARGYVAVGLHNREGFHMRLVSRLVAAAFLGPRPGPNHAVKHLDGDRTNNSADNLAWAVKPTYRLDEDKVRCIRRRHAAGEGSARELAEEYGVNPRTVQDALLGQTWRHVGLLREPQSRAKLAEDQVRAIRAAYAEGGVTQDALAESFGVCQATVWGVVRGHRWKNVA